MMEPTDIQLQNQVTSDELRTFVNSPVYLEAVKNSAIYNQKLCNERRQRLPFFDSQTGIPQNHSNLLKSENERAPGLVSGQIYSYPSKRWMKKRRPHSPLDQDHLNQSHMSTNDSLSITNSEDSPDTSIVATSSAHRDSPNGVSRESLTDLEEVGTPWKPEEREGMQKEPDIDSGHEATPHKTPKIKRGRVGRPRKHPIVASSSKTPQKRGRKKGVKYGQMPDSVKPFSCSLCGIRYKTRPGLNYHYTHFHRDELLVTTEGGSPPYAKPDQLANNLGLLLGDPMYMELLPPLPPSPQPEGSSEMGPAGYEDQSDQTGTRFCSNCQGDEKYNLKTGEPEGLITCSDCGRSAHQSCLQMSQEMAVVLRTYRWQCNECKTCSICDESSKDELFLICHACDRAYHMYCFFPSITSLPEGKWTCELCGNF